MKKILNAALFLSFIAVVMAPVTGIVIHKLAAAAFLLLSGIHMIVYRKKMHGKRWLLSILLLVSFLSGVFGLLFEQFPMLLKVHRTISIALAAFLAVHVSVFYKKFSAERKINRNLRLLS